MNNVFSGGIIFQEFTKYSPGNMCILAVGFFICITGVLVVIKKNNIIARKMRSADEIKTPLYSH